MATPTKPDLAEQRRQLPDSPGVYLFRDADGRVIYVGKAKSIRKRVASHFGSGRGAAYAGHTDLPGQIESIETVVTATEAEAFLAEQEFIHRYRPRFNIRLRDDKSYPYIGISLDEPFPRVYFTRERHRRDRAYFGPYSNAKKTRETLDLLGKIFLFRSCNGAEPGRRSGSPCLDYYIKRCEAPCVGYVDEERYGEAIGGVMDFLSGRYRHIERELEQRMRAAADDQLFEQAALERNRLHAVRALLERQRVANESVGTLDAIAVAMEGPTPTPRSSRSATACSRTASPSTSPTRPAAGLDEVVEEFVLQYYATAMSIPPQVIVQRGLSLTDRAGRGAAAPAATPTSKCARPSAATSAASSSWPSATRGWPSTRSACAMSAGARAGSRRWTACRRRSASTPSRCVSKASTSPTCWAPQTVASMVVFEGGAPKKSDYRRFRIRSLEEGVPDDYAAMEEVLSRRLANYERQIDLSPHDPAYNASFAALPNVILIDGGRGQLAAGLKALDAFRQRGVTIISLAKRIEEVFLPGRAAPLVLGHDTPELQLLQRVRDEAHRFAIEHHRSRRDRAMTVLDLRRAPRHRPVAQARAAQALRLARRRAQRQPRGARGRARGCPARSPATSTPSCTGPGARACRPRRSSPGTRGRGSRRRCSSSRTPATSASTTSRRACSARWPSCSCTRARRSSAPPSSATRAAASTSSRWSRWLDALRDAGVNLQRAVPRGRRADADHPLQGDPPPPPAGHERQRGRGHRGRARAGRAAARHAPTTCSTPPDCAPGTCATAWLTRSCPSRPRTTWRCASARSATSTDRCATPTSSSTCASCPTRTTRPSCAR